MLPAPHRDSHCKNVRRSNGIWKSCSDTEHTRMSQCLRRLVLLVPTIKNMANFPPVVIDGGLWRNGGAMSRSKLKRDNVTSVLERMAASWFGSRSVRGIRGRRFEAPVSRYR